MDFKIHLVKDIESVMALGDSLVDGWIPDPVLMPSGRPNIIDGVTAVYHLVKGSDDDIALYVIKADPGLNLEYAKKKMSEGEPEKSGEFSGVNLSAMLPHGVHPESQEQFKKAEGFTWEFYKAYEKVAVWLRRPVSQGASA